MTPRKLGSELWGLQLAVQGEITPQSGVRLLRRVIKRMNMTPSGEPHIETFPTKDGKGGVGFTIFQTLVESFAVIDAWPELDGFYLSLNSCRPFEFGKVVNLLHALGFDVLDAGGSVVRLEKNPGVIRRLLSWFGWG